MHFLLFQFLSGLWRKPTFDIQGLVYFLIADFEFAFFALMITHPAAYLSSLLFLTAIFRTSSNEASIRTLLLCLDPAGGIAVAGSVGRDWKGRFDCLRFSQVDVGSL